VRTTSPRRRAVQRERRAEFERRLAAAMTLCQCRNPHGIDLGERCARCWESPRHISHALAKAMAQLEPEEDSP
jgi:hypothetical protein